MRHLLLVLCIPFIGFSQQTEKVFFESGVSIFNPVVKEERMITDIQGVGDSDLKYTYKTTPGFFIKCGIEVSAKTQRKFSITVPMSIGYKAFNKETIKEGYAYGCFLNFNGIEKSQTTSKSASIMIGPKFNYHLRAFTVFTAININADLFFMNTEKTEYRSVNSEIYSYTKSQPEINDFRINLSLQLGFDYNVSKQWTLGLSADCYFYNLSPLINNDKLNTKLFNIGYGKQSLFICSGIRAGYTF